MRESSTAVALASRAHGRDGRVLSNPETLARMRAAAAALGDAGRDILAGPTGIVGEGTIVLQLACPEAVLPAALQVASSVRPSKTTFCAAGAAREGPGARAAGDSMEAVLHAADRASTEAVSRVSETDYREARFLVAEESPGELLGTLMGLILEIYDAMTERQRQIVDLARASDTQQQVATHLAISRQAVNQSLTAAGWPHVERAEAIVRTELAALWSDRHTR